MRVVYTSESLSLALVEVLVHLQESAVLSAYSSIRVEFDETAITNVDLADLTPGWREFPAPPETRAIGDAWVAGGRSVILRVPSAVVPVEFNYLINPQHADVGLLRLGSPTPFSFDSRLHRR